MAMVAEAGGPQGHGRLEEPRRTLSRSVRGSVARQHLDLGLVASRAMRAGESTFSLLSAPHVWWPQEANTGGDVSGAEGDLILKSQLISNGRATGPWLGGEALSPLRMRTEFPPLCLEEHQSPEGRLGSPVFNPLTGALPSSAGKPARGEVGARPGEPGCPSPRPTDRPSSHGGTSSPPGRSGRTQTPVGPKPQWLAPPGSVGTCLKDGSGRARDRSTQVAAQR